MITLTGKHTQDIQHGRTMVIEADDWLSTMDEVIGKDECEVCGDTDVRIKLRPLPYTKGMVRICSRCTNSAKVLK